MTGSKLPAAETPQFRTLLLRRLKNLFPSCTAQIGPATKGIAFQLFDREMRPRSGLVNIHRAYADVLTRQSLLGAVVSAGEPEAGYPPEIA